MIRYSLICDRAHDFVSWFPDSASFDTQLKRNLVQCPDCGSFKVGKALMAPAVARRDRPAAAAPSGPAETTAPEAPPAGEVVLLDERRRRLAAMLREMHARVVENTDDVGRRFPEEARRIHEGDAPERAIRGEATREEARALLDDGIDILPVPRPPDAWN